MTLAICMLHYIEILGQAKLSSFHPKSLDRTQVCYVHDTKIELEPIPTYGALRTRC